MSYRISEDEPRERSYPNNKIRNGKRYIPFYGESFNFPAYFHYSQYLVLVLLPVALGIDFLADNNDESVLRKMIMDHIGRATQGPPYQAYKATNTDTYVALVATDIETLYLRRLLPNQLRKELISKNDGAMRGAIYEIALAAAFIRDGYELEWLKGHKQPEFKATKKARTLEVEAKRRNSINNVPYKLSTEINAIKTNVQKALGKFYDSPYMVFIDSDIPPKTSVENEAFYKECARVIDPLVPSGVTVIVTNFGYEHARDEFDSGRNSVLVVQGKDGPTRDEAYEIIKSLHAKLPDPVSSGWKVV